MKVTEVVERSVHFVKNDTGITFYSAVYPEKPGCQGTDFFIYLDAVSPLLVRCGVIKLSDNETMLYITKDAFEYDGCFRYQVKLLTGNKDAYCNPVLLEEGKEVESVIAVEQNF